MYIRKRGICTWGQVPVETKRSYWIPPKLEFIGRCEQPKVGAGNWRSCGRAVSTINFRGISPSLLFFLSWSGSRKLFSSPNTKQALHLRDLVIWVTLTLFMGKCGQSLESHIIALYLNTESPSIIKAFYIHNLKSLNAFWAPNITIHLFIIALSNLDSPPTGSNIRKGKWNSAKYTQTHTEGKWMNQKFHKHP